MRSTRLFRSKRGLLKWAWVCVLALLFQQIALAAYVCPADTPGAMQAMADCDRAENRDPASPALCAEHRQGDGFSNVELKPPQVPSLALPPLRFVFIETCAEPRARRVEDVLPSHSDPPATVRFCSFQI
jgi:hypothetical protein